jgi:hypothetical protein
VSINKDLLQRTLQHIEENPEEWDQTDYRCASGMCFAGWAVTLHGDTWASEIDAARDAWEVAVPEEERSLFPGRFVYAPARAQQLLGLDSSTAKCLFDGGNDIETLRRIVGELCEQEAVEQAALKL